jgi:hypothetical protein
MMFFIFPISSPAYKLEGDPRPTGKQHVCMGRDFGATQIAQNSFTLWGAMPIPFCPLHCGRGPTLYSSSLNSS